VSPTIERTLFAIAAATISLALGAPGVYFNGTPRPLDEDGDTNAAADIGAFQVPEGHSAARTTPRAAVARQRVSHL
jgi:hypothetical protein